MRIVVLGATGNTGSLVVEQALARGHDVAVLARRPEAVAPRPRLTVSGGDVLAPDDLIAICAGADAVVSALGIGSARQPTELYSRGIANVLAAMVPAGARRLAVVAAAPVAPVAEQRFLERRVTFPILERFFGASYDDMRRMEALLRDSDPGVSWTSLRPPRLLDRPAAGAYRISAEPLPKMRSLTFADLATALLDVLGRDDLARSAAYVAN